MLSIINLQGTQTGLIINPQNGREYHDKETAVKTNYGLAGHINVVRLLFCVMS